MSTTKTGKKSIGAVILDRAFFDNDEAERVRRFVVHAGSRRRAAKVLGVTEALLIAATELGTMKHETKTKLFAAIAREEAK